MDIVFFIIKYIPFWSVPMVIIAGYFSYLYWIKDIREIALIFGVVAFFSFVSLSYWIIAGGPTGSVQYIQQFEKQDF
ncbi:hypothetical protein A9Q84_07465 [Halobacteriovorax marinus]|uniref:Uncharacterized protein n=1 Tax=Halobacteriovorax marinus TaxID=97084 RepID=A0A1Y5FBF3_9BACT|nr:hypothetical protein A9Q84_07465 [Halobacteriovorax marinus]